jgi:hypothetical protein
MKNPYWLTAGQGHHLDLQAMRVLCFDIHNIVAASSTLIGSLEFAEPEELKVESPLRRQHYELSEPLLSNRLLHLAIMLRTYDDMMRANDPSGSYAAHAEATSGLAFIGGLSGRLDTPLSLREACNKIIHARTVRPLYERVDNENETANGDPVGWRLTGEVELTGVQSGESWSADLFLQEFLETILERLSYEISQPPTASIEPSGEESPSGPSE